MTSLLKEIAVFLLTLTNNKSNNKVPRYIFHLFPAILTTHRTHHTLSNQLDHHRNSLQLTSRKTKIMCLQGGERVSVWYLKQAENKAISKHGGENERKKEEDNLHQQVKWERSAMRIIVVIDHSFEIVSDQLKPDVSQSARERERECER